MVSSLHAIVQYYHTHSHSSDGWIHVAFGILCVCLSGVVLMYLWCVSVCAYDLSVLSTEPTCM